MKRKATIYLFVILGLWGCSTTKNTAFTRFYHNTTTRYNINFNGKQSFEEGLINITKSNKDDFTDVIPLFPISNHESAAAATSQMDVTIEKCRKAIKLHSIQKKPKKDSKKWSDPKYQAFYNQTEFNPALSDAWIMLAKAEFHKADFIGALGTFSYVMKHYANDKDMVAQCQLWMTRAYAELGWIYEAEDMISKVKQDELKRQNSILYAETYADLLLKKKQYKEALPYVQIAAKAQKKKRDKVRFDFVLAQLYQLNGNDKEAAAAYERVIKSNPSVEMEFNARLNANELSPNKKKAVKQFLKMAKDYKYKDNLDQIYGAVANIYMAQNDSAKAIEYYKMAIEKSTQAAMPKAEVLVTLGDLYYEQRNYAGAQPCYSEAATIIPTDNEDYGRINHLGQTLGELVQQQEIVLLQDSLQRLAKLSEEEQLKVVEKIIADLEAAEKAEAERLAALENEEDGLVSVNTQNMIGGVRGPADWYFYNANLISSGKREFQQKWGQRKLEDNWRRQSKAVVSSFDSPTETYDEEGNLIADSTQAMQLDTAANNPKNPAFYLRQIPNTPEMIAASDEQIATALYNMGLIYKDKVKDMDLAFETFDEFERRFPNDERMCDVYFARYLICLQQENAEKSEAWRLQMLSKFPDCRQTQILQHPDYAQRMLRMQVEQDSLYMATYKAYLKSDYATVTANKQYAEEAYPMSQLMPRFYFLNALAIAKTQTPQLFGDALREMIQKYPESEVSAMAKDMLGLMNQGLESQTGESHGSLITRREQETLLEEQPVDSLQQYAFSNLEAPAVLLVIMDNQPETVNNMLYQVALFNFSQFLIKDFDMEIISYNNNESALKISNFESYKEVVWYQGLLLKNNDLSQLFRDNHVRLLKITVPNLELLLQSLFTEQDYLLFERQNYIADEER